MKPPGPKKPRNLAAKALRSPRFAEKVPPKPGTYSRKGLKKPVLPPDPDDDPPQR